MGSCLQPQDLNISIVKMILSLFFFCVCGIVTSSPVAEVEEDRGLVGDIAMGILVGKIQEMLGITTTPNPVLPVLPLHGHHDHHGRSHHHQVWRSPWRWAPWVFHQRRHDNQHSGPSYHHYKVWWTSWRRPPRLP